MDTDLATTFVTVIECGSFIAAAQKLHMSQTTVTARIKSLESKLNCTLLIRNKKGVVLTENGKRFLPYAKQMIQLWQTSRRDVPFISENKQLIRLACEQSLWNPILAQWLAEIRATNNNLMITTQVASGDTLNQAIRSGFIDIALTHLPIYGSDHCVEHILDEKLILVKNKKSDEAIFVDWGETFRKQYETAFPEQPKHQLYFDFGPAALQYILQHGGHGYFRTRVVHRYLENNTLSRVKASPEFSYPVYLLHQKQTNSCLCDCINAIKNIINSQKHWF